MPKFGVANQLGIIAEAREGLAACRGERLEAEPDGVDDRKRDHRLRRWCRVPAFKVW